jgi:hypothetical protein
MQINNESWALADRMEFIHLDDFEAIATWYCIGYHAVRQISEKF